MIFKVNMGITYFLLDQDFELLIISVGNSQKVAGSVLSEVIGFFN
jgi:hypothetical protein